MQTFSDNRHSHTLVGFEYFLLVSIWTVSMEISKGAEAGNLTEGSSFGT